MNRSLMGTYITVHIFYIIFFFYDPTLQVPIGDQCVHLLLFPSDIILYPKKYFLLPWLNLIKLHK